MGTTNDVLRVLHRIEKTLERIEKKLDEPTEMIQTKWKPPKKLPIKDLGTVELED